jgi:hypothetical protein
MSLLYFTGRGRRRVRGRNASRIHRNYVHPRSDCVDPHRDFADSRSFFAVPEGSLAPKFLILLGRRSQWLCIYGIPGIKREQWNMGAWERENEARFFR